MALTNAENLTVNSELYAALMHREDDKVVEICRRIPKGPLHVLTIHDDTVLHMATYHKKNDLVLVLLNLVPTCDYHKLTWQNGSGSTILHETGTNNRTVEAAEEMLRMAPMLLSMSNKQGETALFYAARHGKTRIFKFLHAKVCSTIQGPDLKTFLKKDDKSTILHHAVLSRNYWMAHEIAIKHEHLIGEKDENEMTALQLLSCCPSGFCPKSFFMSMIYKLIDSDVDNTSSMFPLLKKLRKEKIRCEWGLKLVKLLVKADMSWELTASMMDKRRSRFHQYGRSSPLAQKEEIMRSIAEAHKSDVRLPDTPLLLATKHGRKEIVKEILKVYPQAVEHVDQDGRNILHLAILYRRLEVIDLVVNMEYPKARLRGKIDNNANSLLHMVGEKEVNLKEETKSPALELQEDAFLFKKVADICTTLDTMKLNSQEKTADKVFFENNEKLRSEAKDWMCETAKNCSIVAVLIATVAFAAAYTVPGGTDTTGQPVLKNKPLFLIFTIADAISLSSALTSVIIFLSILTSPFQFKDFERSLTDKLYTGLTLLILSVAAMMVAFAATLILTISSGRRWTDVTLYTVSFFPVFVFVFTYVAFYRKLLASVYRVFKQIAKTTLSLFRKPKHAVWHYKPRSRQPTIGSRSPV